MPSKFINEEVDIFQLPVTDAIYEVVAGGQFTIGDLHGNAMKLLFMLVKQGIAWNIDAVDYNRLVDIYKIPIDDVTYEHLDIFNQILATIKFRANSLVRLLGDELADRGSNDYFTLKILEQLNEHKVCVEILISNHSSEFLEACEKQEDFQPPMLLPCHAQSMINLQKLVDKDLVTRDELLALVKKSYSPTLRAISYSLSENMQHIVIYSHASIGLNTVKNLAQWLGVEYHAATGMLLAQTIDNINTQFQLYVQSNTVHTLYKREKMYQGYAKKSDLSDYPMEFIMWNRLYNSINRPAVHCDYSIDFVHGHDADDLTMDNIYNLDNELGKLLSLHVGTYTVHHTYHGEKVPVSSCIDDFLAQLNEIKKKEQFLWASTPIRTPAMQVRVLYNMLQKNYIKLEAKNIDVQTFKAACTDIIKKARPTLEKYAHWTYILSNLELVIKRFIPKVITGTYSFFHNDLPSKTDLLEHSTKYGLN